MTTKAQKIRVGIFMAMTCALLAIVLIVFGGVRFWQKESTYKIVFGSSVMGLEKGAKVHLNGMRVGRVDEIETAPGDLRKVLVTITVKNSVPIHADTKAILAFAGITGLKVIDLRDGSLTSPTLPPGSLIAEGETMIDKLEKQARDIADQSTRLMANANQIVDNLALITDPKKFEGIDHIIEHSRVTAHNLAATSETLQTMVVENRITLKSALANVDAATKSVEAATKSAATLMDVQVAGLIGKAGEFIAGLENMVRSNEGHLRSTVFDLRQASRNFKELSRDLRQRPSRLLFSNTPGERKLP
jgi:phospholipid/cholesterol/gamma-HCH transport system substrate-binding protein